MTNYTKHLMSADGFCNFGCHFNLKRRKKSKNWLLDLMNAFNWTGKNKTLRLYIFTKNGKINNTEEAFILKG